MGEGTGVLPTDVNALHQLVGRLQSEVSFLSSRATVLEEELRLLRHKVFGRRSERFSEEEKKQSALFDEAGDAQEVPSLQEAAIEVAAHQRAKRGRRPLPADLLREDMVHDIPESEKICSCGAPMVRIGEETSEQLDVIPVQLKVIRHVRPKYACKKCEGLDSAHPVKIAPVPVQIIEKSIATPGLFGLYCQWWTGLT